MAATYVIFLPPFTEKSAGIVCLWRLAETIEKIGNSVIRIICTIHNRNFLISFDGSEWIPCGEDTIPETISPLFQPVIIHGENLDCRYFAGLRVARYYLNKMGALVNKGSAADGEYKIAYDAAFCDNFDFLLPQYTGKISLIEAKHMEINPRSMDLTYIGKGHLYLQNMPVMKGSVSFTREWPVSTDEYLTLLKNTRYLYSYDTTTSVLSDAILMGAVPFVMTLAPWGETEFKKINERFNVPYVFENHDIEKFDFQLFLKIRSLFIDEMMALPWAVDLAPSVVSMCNSIEEFFELK